MKKYLAGASFFVLVSFMAGPLSVSAQSVNNVCGTEDAWQKAIQLHPSLVQERQQLEAKINQYLLAHNMARSADNVAVDSDAVRVIPVVFHILQEGGSENIVDDQVRNCVQVLNTDYRRQNKDTIYTLIPFRPIAADTKIQFQLATLDPNGNCTNGITRTFTHRTGNFIYPYDLSIINWPSDKYLNIWIAEFINSGAAAVGQFVIGLGTLPPEESGYDGVILRYDYAGSQYEAANSYYGRDADHEVGHYLNMIHIWGDANCGNDQVDDTPTQYGPSSGCPCGGTPSDTCYVFDDSCGSPNPPGIMYQNYMDYTDGYCKNLFSNGQKARMRATLDTYRYSLWQPSNLVATGTDSASVSHYNANDSSSSGVCPPVADFLPLHQNLCPGGGIRYQTNTTKGTPTSWTWSFPGGTPDSFSGPNPPLIRYNNQGAYHVILVVSNSVGSDTIDRGSVAIVDWGFGITGVPFSEGFEENNKPVPTEWRVFNDDGGPAWQQTNRAAYSGTHCMSIQNYESLDNAAPNYTAPGSVKELVSPSVNFQYVTNPLLTFRLSYGQQYPGNKDSLSIRLSLNCGASWVELKNMLVNTLQYTDAHLAGSALAAGSGGAQTNDFAPTSPEQWALVSIPLNAYSGQKDVKFDFYFQSDVLSNNIYIDDVNITGTVGVNEEQNPAFEFETYPNPASQFFTVSYTLKQAENLVINLYDVQGRLIRQLANTHQSPGMYEDKIDGSAFNLASGMYILKMITPDGVVSKKLIYSNN